MALVHACIVAALEQPSWGAVTWVLTNTCVSPSMRLQHAAMATYHTFLLRRPRAHDMVRMRALAICACFVFYMWAIDCTHELRPAIDGTDSHESMGAASTKWCALRWAAVGHRRHIGCGEHV